MDYPKLISEKWNLAANINCQEAKIITQLFAVMVPGVTWLVAVDIFQDGFKFPLDELPVSFKMFLYACHAVGSPACGSNALLGLSLKLGNRT